MQVVLASRRCPTARPSRRRSTASCWAACRRAWRRPRHTSRPWRCRGSARLSREPGVLVGGVRDDLVDHHLEAEAVRLGDQRVEIGERAEHRIDVAVVRHVVAEVHHRRGEEGRYPDRVDAERGDVGQPHGDARRGRRCRRRWCPGRSADRSGRSPRRATSPCRRRGGLRAQSKCSAFMGFSASLDGAGQQAAHQIALQCEEDR